MKIRQSISATNRSIAHWVLIGFGFGLLAFALLVWQTPASAAPNAKPAGLDIIVTTTADEYGTGASCSLREAIKTANDNANFGGCVASLSVFGDDTIILPAGIYTLTIAGAGDNSNATGDLDIFYNLIIIGAGSGVTTIDGNALDRVFDLGPYTSPIVAISGVKITNGVAGTGGGINTVGDFVTLDDVVISGNGGCTASGGGIRNAGGVITITNSTITGNCADTVGGGIYNDGGGVITIISSTISLNSTTTLGAGGIFSGNSTTMTLTNTNILSNTAATDGGGIYANSGATLIGYGVTLQGNSALTDSGGGIYIQSSVLTLTNSTLSGNSAAWNGGGILVWGSTINLNNTTVTNNTADSDSNGSGGGGGISQGVLVTITLKNTILAGNIDTGGQMPDCDATLTSQGYNLLGKNGGCTGLTNGVNGDIVGTNASPVNAMLAPLANNGGLTRTHLLIPGSPAYNAGNPAAPGSGGNACLATDQRGVVRPVDGRCDIGAVESVLQIMYLPVIQK